MQTYWLLSCFSLCSIVVDGSVLDDWSIVGGRRTDLSQSHWHVWCSGSDCADVVKGRVLRGSVPGDLVSDLERAGVIDDPLWELNFRTNSSIWNLGNWTYATNIWTSKDEVHTLVLDGVKMGATIRIDGELLGIVTDQFLRYTFTLPKRQHSNRTLSISFEPEIEEDGRFMACSGGWDWAPFTRTNKHEALTMTKGMWKTVYLLSSTATSSVQLLHVIPQITLEGEGVENDRLVPLCDLSSQRQCNKDWRFHVDIRLLVCNSGDAVQTMVFSVSPDWRKSDTSTTNVTVTLMPGEETYVDVTLPEKVDASLVNLWWPSGMGGQPLYEVSVCMTINSLSQCTRRQVAFRTASLVTGNDTDPEYVRASRGKEGNSVFGMYFRVNGEIIYARGSNVIPMDEMEGRYSAEAMWRLVQNAVDANFNMVRIWGGGVFLPNYFYEACDKLGLLVFHDMMYAQRGHSPKQTATQAAEIKHQVARLSHHPSIILWNSCNECVVLPFTPTGIYASFVIPNILQVDVSRVVWPSCPSNGWLRGVHRLSSLPLTRNATLVPHVSRLHRVEVHGPYLHGTGFPAVNGKSELEPLEPTVPTRFKSIPLGKTGPQLKSQFVSEFGAVVMSSFESIAPTLSPKHHALHGGSPKNTCDDNIYANTCSGSNAMAERNYPCDNLIYGYFGREVDLETVGEQSFRAQLYLCQLAQALFMKSIVEEKRSRNGFGAMTWQLNEIWPTGGWGSVEYGSERPGQVVGGRWKILHHWFARAIFKDVFATCGADDWCFVKVDRQRPLTSPIRIMVHDYYQGAAGFILATSHVLQPSSLSSFAVLPWQTGRKSSDAEQGLALRAVTVLTQDDGLVLCHHVVPFSLQLLQNPEDASLSFLVEPNHQDDSLLVRLEFAQSSPQGELALFVHLTTLAQGRFEDNGFVFTRGHGRSECLAESFPLPSRCFHVRFLPYRGGDESTLEILRTTLRVQHLSQALRISKTTWTIQQPNTVETQ